MQERTSLEDALSGISKVERELEDNVGMIELGEAENDEGVVAEAEQALKDLKKEVARRELEALLSGEADKFDSYLEVHAGAGGTESQDWAEMLQRMYQRWAEKRGYKVEFVSADHQNKPDVGSASQPSPCGTRPLAATATADASGTWSCAVPASLVDGPHTLVAVATDVLGNEGEPTTSTFIVETPTEESGGLSGGALCATQVPAGGDWPAAAGLLLVGLAFAARRRRR